ncbi:MAG: hypothetical protein EOM08_11875 [Clostridia bacterium]|nr:hypothetical protein [Clostridia bacterium]
MSLRYAPPLSIRISAKYFGFANQIFSLPLYAVFCLQRFALCSPSHHAGLLRSGQCLTKTSQVLQKVECET